MRPSRPRLMPAASAPLSASCGGRWKRHEARPPARQPGHASFQASGIAPTGDTFKFSLIGRDAMIGKKRRKVPGRKLHDRADELSPDEVPETKPARCGADLQPRPPLVIGEKAKITGMLEAHETLLGTPLEPTDERPFRQKTDQPFRDRASRHRGDAVGTIDHTINRRLQPVRPFRRTDAGAAKGVTGRDEVTFLEVTGGAERQRATQ